MNIFEQYGIKEVADCTLYAIALDKYDDEVYIPIMYFDTLKVSTIEQTASETSARGGLGNPHLITWNFDKEITVRLEDALYSPASQSLMWGGQFGIGKQKIYGVWDPYEYEVDGQGKPIYVKKKVISEEEYNNLSDDEKMDYVGFICPCDYQKKYATYEQADGKYKYASKDSDVYEEGHPYAGCFKGISYQFEKENKKYDIIEDTPAVKNHNASIYTCEYILSRAARPERAELILDAFGDFDYNAIKYDITTEPTDTSAGEGIAEEVELCNAAHGLKSLNCEDPTIDELEYVWLNSDVKMVSLEGNQDVYYGENMGVRYRTPIDQIDKTIMAAQRRLYNSNGKEVIQYDDEDLLITNGEIKWELDPYDSKINFYINLHWNLLGDNGVEVNHYTRILVGTFYIIETLNYNNNTMNDMIHPLDYGINDVYYFDRMEKCVAPRTFCINADRNIHMEQLRQLPQYSQAEMTVYYNPKTMKPYEPNTDHFHRRNGSIVKGNLTVIKQDHVYYKWMRRRAPKYMSLGRQIIVDASHFPGTYRLVGETYSRSREDGKDQRYQFDIPLCKMGSNTNLTLEAAGDPTTFTMEMRVLQREDGVMMKLTQYDVENAIYDGYCSDSHEIVPTDALFVENKCEGTASEPEPTPPPGPIPPPEPTKREETESVFEYQTEIISPIENTVYCVPVDCNSPYSETNGNGIGQSPFIDLNSDNKWLTTTPDSQNDRDKLIVKLTTTENVITHYYEDEIEVNKTEETLPPVESILQAGDYDVEISYKTT